MTVVTKTKGQSPVYVNFIMFLVTVKMEKHQHAARSEDGRLHYDGEWYGRGQAICIDKKDEYPTR